MNKSQGMQSFCELLMSEPEIASQEIQKRIKRIALTPKETADGVVLEVSGDVELLRAGDVLVESPLDGTLQQYIGTSLYPFKRHD
jgi:hypothetical protein